MSLTLNEIKGIQKNFDLTHSVNGKGFYVTINEKNIHELEHLAVCLTGEIGEFCNLLKKVVRGDVELSKIKSNMNEELADCFIYLIKIANQFDVDIESEFIKKVNDNKNRYDEI